MRRNIKGVKPRCQNRKRRILAYLFLFLSLCCFLFVLTYKYLDNKILPIVVAMSQMKIQTIATQSINDAVQKNIGGEADQYG